MPTRPRADTKLLISKIFSFLISCPVLTKQNRLNISNNGTWRVRLELARRAVPLSLAFSHSSSFLCCLCHLYRAPPRWHTEPPNGLFCKTPGQPLSAEAKAPAPPGPGSRCDEGRLPRRGGTARPEAAGQLAGLRGAAEIPEPEAGRRAGVCVYTHTYTYMCVCRRVCVCARTCMCAPPCRAPRPRPGSRRRRRLPPRSPPPPRPSAPAALRPA